MVNMVGCDDTLALLSTSIVLFDGLGEYRKHGP